MLQLRHIVKEYKLGDTAICALRNVSIDFRKSEFVSVLGPSGCGKTTLLNIIGGLDKYTSGDLVINGKSTKQFTDSDWDNYRNHSVGFVFQNYNLIPHQTVLANVELALTLSGVSSTERRKRAVEALEKVGLENQLKKKPNQMSGGQMQRVAIARALVNDPDILLADEPTGALDSETSLQIMELLKQISKDKLVIMVTHNPELAQKYSTRIVKLLDGCITDDSCPCDMQDSVKPEAKKKRQKRNMSMSFATALSLSLNNLLTKKTRTFLTAFAGSIGIIGIALILSLSNGIQKYIERVEEDMFSSYPITIEETTVDFGSMISEMMSVDPSVENRELDRIYSSDIMGSVMGAVAKEVEKNNLEDFKKYIESDESGIRELCTDIQYSYSTPLNIYRVDTDEVVQVNPNTVFEDMGFGVSENQNEMMYSGGAGGMDVWRPLIGDNELLEKQYDIIAGRLPEKLSEVVLIVNENNEISDFTLYSLGLKDSSQLEEMMQDIQAGKEFETLPEEYSYEEILALRFKFLPQSDLYVEIAGKWSDFSEDMEYVQNALENALEIKVVGIIRPSENASISSTEGVIGYCPELMEYAVEAVNESPVVKQQISEPDIDVFTGLPFESGNAEKIDIEMIMSMLDMLSEEEKAQYVSIIEQMRVAGMNDDQIANMLSERMAMQTDATYEGNLEILGVGDLDKPSAINIYPKDFEAKDTISSLIEEYNRSVEEENQIQYTDYVGLLMSSVTTIINTISYVLVAFVSISLVVSSIMIGIITYISVLERTREIGVLRAMGASKRDISRVFNAETLIVGFIAGAVGIGLTLLLNIPINAIIEAVADIKGVAALPAAGGIILVMISMFLTFVAGLIPSRIAANKDPVVALRTE